MRDWQKLVSDIIRQRNRAIAADYEDGMLVREIATRYGLASSTVHGIIDRADCERRGRGKGRRKTERE